jgi:SAM-dependent methyltransferase
MNIETVNGRSYFGPFAVLARESDRRVVVCDPYDFPFAQIYEARFAEVDFDVQFFLAAALASGGPVLDLGCGGGRLAVELAARGLVTDAIDRSPAMLALLTERSTQLPPGAVLRSFEADLFAAPPETEYQTIIVGAGMFTTFLSAGGRAWLAQLYEHLRPKGHLCFDANVGLAGGPEAHIESRSVFLGGDSVSLIEGSMRTGSSARTTNLYAEVGYGSELRRYLTSETIIELPAEDLRSELACAGFVVESVVELRTESAGPPLACGWTVGIPD